MSDKVGEQGDGLERRGRTDRRVRADELRNIDTGEALPIWQVIVASHGESRFEALRQGTRTPLVGRDKEIELLLRRWD